MLLICKNLSKKQSSSSADAKVKVIRQPYLVDRLLVSDVSRDGLPLAGLACMYMSELGVVAAAFTLHSNETKIIKVS